MYVLHYFPGNASLMPHILLREIGADFTLQYVDRASAAQKSAAYLRLNPNGMIPVLQDGDDVLFETAAIALYLADRHPEAALAPPAGSRARGQFYKWMVHLTNTPQAEYRRWFYPHEHADEPAAVAAVKRVAGQRLEAMFDRIAAQLGAGPYLLGETFSAADVFLMMLTRWGRAMPRPPRALPEIAAHAERVVARPAVLATFAAEGIEAPFV
jgi:glutathione S-transferase